MQSIVTGSRQCLLDLAMEHAGDAEAAFNMSVQYNVPLTIKYDAGTVLPKPEVINENVVTLYKSEKAKPASILSADGEGLNFEGIGYWFLEDDFIVQ